MSYRPLPPWQVLARRTLVSRHWLQVHEEHVRLANGHEIPEFHLITAPSWVGVVAVAESGDVILVRQYRHGLGKESLELPAGVIEEGEAPLDAAKRELREETGYTAERWELIADFAPEPARHTAHAHFYCALGAKPSFDKAPDDTEDLEVVVVSREALLALLLEGGMVHGVHVGAILLAERRGLLALG